MASFNDVATNAEILRIADAIRAVTRTAECMTIPEMPDRLMDIRVVECKDVQIELNTQGEVLLGVFDPELKHMFVVTPYTDQDNEAVNAAGVQRELIFDQGAGSLYLYEEVETDLTARLIVMDFLLASDQTSGGVMMKGEIQDISGKLDKVTSIGYGRVYGITSQGLQITRDCRDAAVADSLPIRDANGTFQIGEPKSDNNPATKKYVDSAVNAITPEKIGAVKKVTDSSDFSRLYGILPSGGDGTYVATDQKLSKTIPQRDSNGTFQIGEPTNDSNPATKKYVDTALGDVSTALAAILGV